MFAKRGYTRIPPPRDINRDGIIGKYELSEHLARLGYCILDETRITPKEIEILGYRATLYDYDDTGWGPIFVPTSDDGKSGFWIIGATVTGGPPVGRKIIFTEEFNLPKRNYTRAVDASVTCTNNPTNVGDVGFDLIPDQSSPSNDKNILIVLANKTKRPGIDVNSIVNRNVPDYGSGIYEISGYMRRIEGSPSGIDFNFTRCRNYIEYPAEILIYGDGRVATRYGENFEPYYLTRVKLDNWHFVRLRVLHDIKNNVYLIKEAQVDDQVFPNLDLPMTRLRKSWPRHLLLMWETSSSTCCDPNRMTYGIGGFDGFKVTYEPLSK